MEQNGWLPPHVGSDSVMIDRRSRQRSHRPDTRLLADGFETIPVADELRELCAALSMSKSQLARILRVNRLTVYEWYEGREPDSSKSERIRTLLGVLKRNAVFGVRPLNGAFCTTTFGAQRAVAAGSALRGPTQRVANRVCAPTSTRSRHRRLSLEREPGRQVAGSRV